jgi:hypothetical protein
VSQILVVRSVGGLSGADDHAKAALRAMPIGTVARAELVIPRNLKHHRKFFALLQLVWASSETWPSVEDLLIELKVRLGVTKDVILRDTGEVVKVLGSISFAKMDEAQFNEFYERAIAALCELAGGIEADVLRNEVLNQLASA